MKLDRKISFSNKVVKELQPPNSNSSSKEVEYSDITVGLKLRIAKNSRRFFMHRYHFNKRKFCINIGEFPAVSVEDARQMVNDYKLLIARNINPAFEKNKVKSDLTFAQFCPMYLEFARHRLKSYQDQKYRIDHFMTLYPAFAKTPLAALSIKDIALLHIREKERTSASNANHLFSLVRSMLNVAVNWELIGKNPCTGVSKFHEGPLRERYLSREELPRFLKALSQEDDTLSKAAILLLLYTGCRRNEIVSMKWDQVRLDEGRLYLPVTKNGKSRAVLLNQKASEVLQDLACRKDDTERTRKSDYVFPSREGTKKGYLYDLRKTLMNVCEIAEIKNFRCHDLRHTFASLAVSSGADLYAVQRLLGHSDISMTQRYAHLANHDLRIATQGVSGLIDQIAA